MWKKLVSVLLCAVFMLCFFTSCSPEERTLTLPVSSIPAECDPVVSDSTAQSSLAANCFEGLVRVDENGNVQPGAADHWSISDDGLTYNFILKDDLKWHVPGRDDPDAAKKHPLGESFITSFPNNVTADDFVFGLQRAVAKSTNAPGASRLFSIVNAEAVNSGEVKSTALGVSAPDDKTVRIHLSSPDSNFLNALADPCAMPCSRTFFNKTAGRYGLSADLLLCNGPYYLSSMNTAGTSVTITKNPDYTGSFSGTVDRCTFVLASEDSVEAENNSTSDKKVVDILADFQSDEGSLDGAILSESAAESLPKSFSAREYSNIVNALVFNMESEFAGNEDLRLALAHATNPVTLVPEDGRIAEGVVPDCCDSVNGTMYRLSAGKAGTLAFNLKKAKKYYAAATEKFEAAATKDDPAPTSFAITFLCLEKDKNLAKTIVQNWQKVYGTNLSITVETRETDEELNAALVAGRYDVAYAPMHCTELIATNVLSAFAGTTDANIVHLASDEYDYLIRKASSAGSAESVTDYCLQAEQYLIQKGIMIPVSQESTILATKKKTADGLNVLPTGDTYLVYLVK